MLVDTNRLADFCWVNLKTLDVSKVLGNVVSIPHKTFYLRNSHNIWSSPPRRVNLYGNLNPKEMVVRLIFESFNLRTAVHVG